MKIKNSKVENQKIEIAFCKNWKSKSENSKSQVAKVEIVFSKLTCVLVELTCVLVELTCVLCVYHVLSCSLVDIDPLAADGNDSNDCKWSTPQSLQLHVVSYREMTQWWWWPNDNNNIIPFSYIAFTTQRESCTQALPHWLIGDQWDCDTERGLLNPLWTSN